MAKIQMNGSHLILELLPSTSCYARAFQSCQSDMLL